MWRGEITPSVFILGWTQMDRIYFVWKDTLFSSHFFFCFIDIIIIIEGNCTTSTSGETD